MQQEASIVHQQENAIYQSINLVSINRRYQFLLAIFFAINLHIMAISSFSSPIVFSNPTFICQGYTQPVSEVQACYRMIILSLQNLHYIAMIQPSIKEISYNLSASGLGAAIGMLMVNWLADRKGKRFCIIWSTIVCALHAYCLLLGIWMQNMELIVLSQFLLGYTINSYATIVYLLMAKYLGQLSEYTVVIFSLFSSGMGQISVGIMNSYFTSWQNYLILYIVAFTLSSLATPFIVKEDPIFLFNNNQMDKLMNLLQEIGTFNGVDQPQILQAQNNLIHKYRFKRSPQICQIIPHQIFSFKVILLILIMSSCAFTNNLVYNGISFGIQTLKFTMTQSLYIFGMAEITNYLLTAILMPYFPSIQKCIWFSSIVSSLGFFLLSLDIMSHSFLLRLTAVFIARFFLVTYACFYTTYYIQNLPKSIEGTSAGLIEGTGSFGKVSAPLLMSIAQKLHINSGICFGVVMILGTLPLSLLYKTKQEEAKQQKQNSTSHNKQ